MWMIIRLKNGRWPRPLRGKGVVHRCTPMHRVWQCESLGSLGKKTASVGGATVDGRNPAPPGMVKTL